MPLDEEPMNRGAPAVSITSLAESDLTFPEGSGSMFFLKVDTIPTIYVVPHLYSLHPNYPQVSQLYILHHYLINSFIKLYLRR